MSIARHLEIEAFPRLRAWVPVLLGVILFLGAAVCGAIFAFPHPDATVEEVRDFHITWTYAWLVMRVGLVLFALGVFLAAFRNPSRNIRNEK